MAKNTALGSTVRDRITGFEGVAMGRTSWLTGCDRIAVQPVGLSKDGKLFDIEWFDEPRLDVTKSSGAYLDEDVVVRKIGGGLEEGRRSFDPPSH